MNCPFANGAGGGVSWTRLAGLIGRDSPPCSSREKRLVDAMPITAAVSDAVLLQQFCASRSEGAFAQIVSRHGGLVYRACLRLVADPSDAEDAVQAVFLVLAQRCRSVNGPLGPWLLGVARRVAHNLLMARLRRRRYERAAAKAEPRSENAVAGLRRSLIRRVRNFLPRWLRQSCCVTSKDVASRKRHRFRAARKGRLAAAPWRVWTGCGPYWAGAG